MGTGPDALLVPEGMAKAEPAQPQPARRQEHHPKKPGHSAAFAP
jgi:hypothetical protein